MSLQSKLRTFPLALALGATLLSGCVATTKSLTGRTQLDIVSEAQVSATVDQYYGFQRMQAKNLQKLVTKGPQYDMLQDVTNRLIEQAVRIYPASREWKWELILIDERNTENAFCMHGGKMGFYTGFFYKSKVTEDEIAHIMGHEIGHALAGHAKEKMSMRIASQLATSVGTQIIGQATGNRQLTSTGLSLASNTFVTLPNGRETELEADHIGAELAARAGFKPEAGAGLWDKIAAASGKSSDFFSTHPAHDRRAETLRTYEAALQPIYQAATKYRYTPFDWLNGPIEGRPPVTEAQRLKMVDVKNPPSAQQAQAQASVRLIPAIAPVVNHAPQVQPPAPSTKPLPSPKPSAQKPSSTTAKAPPAATPTRKAPTEAECDRAGQMLSRYATVKKLSNGRYLMASEKNPKNTWTISASWYAQVGSPKVGDVACFEYE